VPQRVGDETILSFGGPGGDPLLGTIVESYRVESVVGTGSMGIVYRAVHTLIGKPAAIKVLKRDYADDPEMVQRLVREARTVNAIRHPSIVNAFGFGTLQRTGQPYIVMDLLLGEPLDVFIKREAPVSLRTAATILDELLSGLYAAHQVGVIHRDMKPGNCFLERQPDGGVRLKLLDFGLARQADRVGGSIRPTNPGTLIGTPAFMAPEQVMGQKVTPATDLYAVGGIAYQLLTGHLPHDASSAIEVLTQKMKHEPTRPRHHNPRIDEDVEAWILSLLARDPEQRPRDADAVRRALRRLTETRTLSGAPAHPAISGSAKRGGLVPRREWGEAQTILVEGSGGSPDSSTDAHKSPWARTQAISPGDASSSSQPNPDLTPPNPTTPVSTAAMLTPHRANAFMFPPTGLEPSAELLPPTIPTGTKGVSARDLSPVQRHPPRRVEQATMPGVIDPSLRARPMGLWVVLGVLAALIVGLGAWVLGRT